LFLPCIRQKRKCYHSNNQPGKRDLHFTASQLHGVATTLHAGTIGQEQINMTANEIKTRVAFYTSQASVHGDVYMFPSILQWKSGIITIITRMWLRAAAATGAC
jgi:hypothetical protein